MQLISLVLKFVGMLTFIFWKLVEYDFLALGLLWNRSCFNVTFLLLILSFYVRRVMGDLSTQVDVSCLGICLSSKRTETL